MIQPSYITKNELFNKNLTTIPKDQKQYLTSNKQIIGNNNKLPQLYPFIKLHKNNNPVRRHLLIL